MPAAHDLTGTDMTKKIGTNGSLIIRTGNFKLLKGFGLSELSEEMFLKVEPFSVYYFTVNKADCINFNQLRVYLTLTAKYYICKKMPCTTVLLREHIKLSYLQAKYAEDCHMDNKTNLF